MKKAIGMFAALILALGMTGVAFAHWEKIITIEGTVTTGTFHLTPSFHVDPLVEAEDKEVATLEYGIDIPANSAWIKLGNVYPSLWVYGYIDIHNDGTIPAGLVSSTPTTVPVLTFVPVAPIGVYAEGYDIIQDGITGPIANLYYYFEGDIDQIDPGKTAYIYWAIHFKEDLPEDALYEFNLQFTFWNWNEVPI